MEQYYSDLCVYCGATENLTRDHVVPSCLFARKPQNPVMVSSCKTCADRKSNCDQYLRDFLVLDNWASSSPTAIHLLHTKVLRGVRKRRSPFVRALGKPELRPFRGPSGLYMGDLVAADFDGQPIIDALTYIVRGLFYRVKRRTLSTDYSYRVTRFLPDGWARLNQLMVDLGTSGWNEIGDIFAASYVFVQENDDLGWWIFRFYGGVIFTVYVDDPTLEVLEAC